MTKLGVSMALLQAVRALNNFPSEKDFGDRMSEKLEGTILPTFGQPGSRLYEALLVYANRAMGSVPSIANPRYGHSRRAQGLPSPRYL